MKGTLYRYPHPTIDGKWLYVGQGPNRDSRHKSGASEFGRRFKVLFPGVELPQPVKEVVEVENQLELNGSEIIWMFRYHTWRGYDGGMNLTLPGSHDYRNMGLIGGSLGSRSQPRAVKVANGRRRGRQAFESGFLASISSKGGQANIKNGHARALGLKYGRLSVENGRLSRMLELPQTKEGQSKNMRSVCHIRWHVNRSIINPDCALCI
jgi:hypothetical protein